MTRYSLNILGSDLSDSDGDTGRTYTLPYSNIITSGIIIFVSGTYYNYGTEYSISGSVITFTDEVFDSQIIQGTYFTSDDNSIGTTTNYGYSSPLSLTKHLYLLGSYPDHLNKTRDSLGTGDSSNDTFWFSKLGVLAGTYTLSYGTSETSLTDLTETTHYTVDLDTSKVTLTSAGVTALAANILYASYKYNTEEILNSELVKAINAAETKVNQVTEQLFAEFSDDNPGYRKVLNEIKQGHYNPVDKVFDFYFNPLLDFGTTVNGAYTTGDTEIVLTSVSGLPSAGTLYIGGNKVTYNSKTGTTLTIPSTTPSIADGATVRAEIIEISTQSEGASPSYTILDPDTEYKIDFMQGRVKILSNAYENELDSGLELYPSNYLIRLNYMTAWRENGSNPTIPDEIEEVVNMIASKKFVQRMVKKAHITGMNDFNPSALNSGDDEINRILEYYKPLNVGTSMYNKQFIS